MNDLLEQQKQAIEVRHVRKRRMRRLVSILAAATVFMTTYSLILPAITLERDLSAADTVAAEPSATEPQLAAVTVPGEPQLSETQPESEPSRAEPEEPSVSEPEIGRAHV